MTDIVSANSPNALSPVSTTSTLAQQQAVRQIAEQQQQDAPSRSTTAGLKFSKDFDNFLTLLTTQLTNQDPLSPLDTHEFTNQLVQFAAVEQQIHQSGELEKIAAMLEGQQSSTLSDGVGYLGKEVLRNGTNQFLLEDQGSARLQYVLPAGAQNARIEVRNANGNIVYKNNAAGLEVLDAGKHFRKQSSSEDFSFTLPRAVARAVATITDSEGRLVHSQELNARAGSGSWSWDGRGNELGAQRNALGKIEKDGDGNTVWRKAEEGDYQFSIQGALTPREGEQGASRRTTFVWNGRGVDGEPAQQGRYNYHIAFETANGATSQTQQYASPARVVGIVSDPERGVRLQLDTGAEVGVEDIIGLRN